MDVTWSLTQLLFYCGRWLDKLGLSAQKGVGVVIRQTLYGYDYSLLDIDMNPNPVGTCMHFNPFYTAWYDVTDDTTQPTICAVCGKPLRIRPSKQNQLIFFMPPVFFAYYQLSWVWGETFRIIIAGWFCVCVVEPTVSMHWNSKSY